MRENQIQSNKVDYSIIVGNNNREPIERFYTHETRNIIIFANKENLNTYAYELLLKFGKYYFLFVTAIIVNNIKRLIM